MLIVWPLVIRFLHDALIEDLLDRAELEVTGHGGQPRPLVALGQPAPRR